MAQYTIRRGNVPADLFVGNGIVTNFGPGTIYYADSQDVTPAVYDGTLAANARTSLEGVQWFTTDAPSALLDVVPGQTTVGQGPPGPPGPSGPQGPGGQDAVESSDAIRGQVDHFNRLVGGVLIPSGGGFTTRDDSISRPANIDHVTTDVHRITVVHEEILPRALLDSDATTSESMKAVGIEAQARTASDLKSTDVLLRQTRSLNDTLTNPGDGSAWLKERGLASPFTAVGVTNVSANFATYTQGLANVAAAWRLSEASGATLDDAIGANDGAVVGSGTTYGVTGGLPTDGTDKALTTTGISTNELTFPMAGITQAAFSLATRMKFPVGTTPAFRDGTSVTGTGYFVGSDGGSPAHVQYRMGSSGSTYVTTMLWSALADGNWHTIIITKSGANVALYIDGELTHSAANAGSTALAGSWHFGRNGTTTPYNVVTVSEVVTYSRALTADEARNVHEAGTTTGLLRITHTDVGSTKSSEIKLTKQGLLSPEVVPGSVTTTGFNVRFRDVAGALVLTADANMVLGISRDVANVEINPTNFSVPIFVEKIDDWDVGVLATEPTLFARLGEPSGTTFNDEVGTNDGASQATVTLGATGAISGDADTAVTFDGAQGKIGFANPVLPGPFSISIWFKCTGAGSVGNNVYGTIIGWAANRRILIHHSDGIIRAEVAGAALSTPIGTAPTNQWNHLVFTWDGTTQSMIVNGLLAASSVTSNTTFAADFYLGSYQATSIAYSFKGDMDELVLWDRKLTTNEAQQLYVDGSDTVLSVDRADQVQIKFHAFFETFAPPVDPPPEQPAPEATPLPADDPGGGATSYQPLTSYRSVLNATFYDWVGRLLPAVQVDRDAIELNGLSGLPAATSDNWKNWFCLQWGIDPNTGATTGNGLSGNATPLYMSIAHHNVYVVDDDQPLRDITDLDVSVPGWATQINDAVADLGGLPIPADALPDFTPDRYNLVYQPGTDMIVTVYAHQPLSTERARSTISLTSAPSTGGFFLEFDYEDNVNKAINTFFTQAPVPYNCTAAQLRSLLEGAKTTAGIALGAARSGANPVNVTGGPLNVAPLVCEWIVAGPLQPVGMRINNNFLNAGTVHFDYENAEAWSGSRLSAITSPDVPNGHVPLVGGLKACATATHIVQLPIIIDWDEYRVAYEIGIADGWDAPGSDMGHVVGFQVGNCGTGFVYPANHGDGSLSNVDGSKMKEGCLGTFPVDADFSRVSPAMMPLANTIKRYGFMVYDKTNGGCQFVFRNWVWPGQTRPFPGPSTFITNNTTQRVTYMRQLPWHQLQVIDPAAVLAGW